MGLRTKVRPSPPLPLHLPLLSPPLSIQIPTHHPTPSPGFGFKTFGDLPGFPNIGGIPAITGWNSPSCGTCWNLTYMDNTIMVLGVDTGGSGFNIALGAMQSLTGGNAIDLGVVTATVAGPMPLASCNTTQGRKNGKPEE